MALQYTLVQGKDMSEGAAEDAKLYYARAVSSGEMTFEELCEDIAETCTLTSADVKAVLNFRLTVGSRGTINKEDFNASLIKKPKVVFHPGKRIQEARAETAFERIGVTEEEEAGAA